MNNINVFKKLDKYIYDENLDGLLFVDNGKGLIQCEEINKTIREDENGNTIYKAKLNKGRIINTVLADLYMFPLYLEQYFMNHRTAFIDNCNIDCIGGFMYKNKVNVGEILISTSSMSYLNGKGEISNRGESAMSITIYHNNGNKYVYCIPVTKNYHKVELKAIAVYIMDNFYNTELETMKELNDNYCAIYTEVKTKYEYVSGERFNMLDSLYTTVPINEKTKTYSYKERNYNSKDTFKLLDAERGYIGEDGKRVYTENGKHIYFINNYKIISLATGIATIINLNTNKEVTVYCNICRLCSNGFIDYMLKDENKDEFILDFNDVDGFDLTDVCEDYRAGREYDLRNNLVKLIKRNDNDLVERIMEECGYANDNEIDVESEIMDATEENKYDLSKLGLTIYTDEENNLDCTEFNIGEYSCIYYENGELLINDNGDYYYALINNDDNILVKDKIEVSAIKEMIEENDVETIKWYVNKTIENV
jgi:hypothetical protein